VLRALWRGSFVRDIRPVTIPWYGRVSEGCFDFEEEEENEEEE
jgi:hypothetical protein